MELPEFLRRESLPKEKSEFAKAIENYEKYFGIELSTEPSYLSSEEWIELIELCLKTDAPLKCEILEDVDY